MFFKIVRGYNLHPKVTLASGARIADIGTGTCIWPIDIVRELQFPVTVDAIDISLAQCPPPSWLPENINLIAHDVHQPFPVQMQGKYDLVHVQNWLCIWRTESSGELIRNLLSLLKPGGYIQWSEQDPDANRAIVAPNVSCSTQATEEVLRFLNAPRSTISFEWVSRLGEYLNTQARLLAFDRFTASNAHQQLWTIGALQACEEMASNLERKAPSEENTERAGELRSSVERAGIEMLKGVGVYSELVVAVAQKGSSEPAQGGSQPSL
ncbi:MAG: hypothetical protein Q9207_005178 [Kuettlingeria erythrocarpa]